MAKLYIMIIAIVLFVQGIFGELNVSIGDIENNNLTKINGGNGTLPSTNYICPAKGNCISRGDPNYVIPKSYGKEKIDGVFSDITNLDGLENNKKGAIIEACNIGQFNKKKCKTRKCAVNEDCLSGICKEGSCITNPDNILYECEKNKESDGMFCLKYLQEQCISDSECSGRCKKFICTYKNLNSLNTSPWVYYSTGIATMACLIALFCCCLCCPGLIFRWNVKDIRNNNNPPVVV